MFSSILLRTCSTAFALRSASLIIVSCLLSLLLHGVNLESAVRTTKFTGTLEVPCISGKFLRITYANPFHPASRCVKKTNFTTTRGEMERVNIVDGPPVVAWGVCFRQLVVGYFLSFPTY